MSKTNKELAIELLGNYINAVYSQDNARLYTPEELQDMAEVFYNAVKQLPDD